MEFVGLIVEPEKKPEPKPVQDEKKEEAKPKKGAKKN